ncbi:uncharacterized threonine-rich GPI-anchored glycoprotein PJ4664.02-like isoform X1 [Tachysurus ichikawai]
MVMTLENKLRFAFSKNHGTRKTTLLTILCVWWVLTWTGAQAPDLPTVTAKLVFNCSFPVPSESLVLNAIATLLNSRSASILNTVKVLGFYYTKTSGNSYEVVFIISVNVIMPDDFGNRKNIYKQIQTSIDNTLNRLLNEPKAESFESQSASFRPKAIVIHITIEFRDLTTVPSEDEVLTTIDAEWNIKKARELGKQIPDNAVSIQCISYETEILTRLVISNSSPLPCESMVISAIQTLLNNQGITFPDNVTVMNYTYEKMSDTSYAINITFYMTNIRMHGNDACCGKLGDNIKSSVNNAINKLLNKPCAEPFEEVNFDFSGCSQKPIHSYMEYSFQDGTNITPVSFIEELGTQSDSACPKSNPVTPSAHPSTIIGKVYIFITVIFENLTNVPTEAEVVNAANALLESKIRTERDLDTQILNEPVSIKNITYQKTGSNSYSIDFAFQISNVNVPILLDQRNQTYDLIQYKINSLMNTILNDPTGASVIFTQANYQGNDAVINAFETYIYKEGDINSPSLFLYKLHILHNQRPPATTTPESHLILPSIGSTVVQTRLVFNSSSPVLNVSEVVSAIKAMLNATLANLSDPVTVLNFTYEEITNTSSAVTITFNISDISISTNADLMNDNYTRVKSIINEIVNTLLNDTGAGPFQPSISNFMRSEDKVYGYMVYIIPSIPAKPGNIAKDCSVVDTAPTVATSSTPMQTSPGSSPTINGSAVVQTRLVFNSSSPVPSKSEVLSAIEGLLNSTLRNLTDLVTVLNITYEEISNTSNAVTITFKVSDISIPTNSDLMNITYNQVENIINEIVNGLLKNYTSADQLEPSTSNFTSSEDKVNGYMVYNIPSIPAKPGNVISNVFSHFRNGTVLIYIKLIFQNLIIVPPKTLVLKAANEKLESKIRRQRDTATQTLEQPVSTQDIIYTKTGNNSFSLDLAFQISHVNLSNRCDTALNNNTYELIQNKINGLMNTILSKPQAPLFYFPQAHFTCNYTAAVIVANVIYVYKEGDIRSPSSFLLELLKESGLLYYTLPPLFLTIEPHNSGNSTYTSAAWILGFVIPCGIVIILLPCWILLCCLLCGCCARIRRRWRRRQSYNVQYETHNSLF